MASISVKCKNPDCPKNETVINTISGLHNAYVQEFIESWKSGDDEDDICPECHTEGVLDATTISKS